MDLSDPNVHSVENRNIIQVLTKLQNLSTLQQQITADLEELKKSLIEQATSNIKLVSTIQKQITADLEDSKKSLIEQATSNIPQQKQESIQQNDVQITNPPKPEIQTAPESDDNQARRYQEVNRTRQNFGRTVLQNTRLSANQYAYNRRQSQPQMHSNHRFQRRPRSVPRMSAESGYQKRTGDSSVPHP